MTKEARISIDDLAIESFRLPRIVTSCSGYAPPFDLEPTVSRMLGSVPPKYLNGLSEIVITNTGGLPRSRKRSVTKSRKHKVRIVEARGLYHPAGRGSAPWIELLVDNILKPWQKGIWLKLAFLREGLIADVLFHEIGHHIHATSRPEFRDREDVADAWGARLRASYNRARYPYLTTVLFPFRPLTRRIRTSIVRKMLGHGAISGAEFDESIKGSRRRKRKAPLS